MEDKIKRLVSSIGMECLVKSIEDVFNGGTVDDVKYEKTFRTRTSNIKRIIKNDWGNETLLIVRSSRKDLELGDLYEAKLKKLGII